jgi:hypothetical protein
MSPMEFIINRSAVGSSINEKTVGRGIVPLVG